MLQTPGQSEPKSNSNEDTLHSPKLQHHRSLTIRLLIGKTPPPMSVLDMKLYREIVGVFYSLLRLGHKTLVGEVLPLCRNAFRVFYYPNRLNKPSMEKHLNASITNKGRNGWLVVWVNAI